MNQVGNSDLGTQARNWSVISAPAAALRVGRDGSLFSTECPGFYHAPDGELVVIEEALTEADKKLVTAAAGALDPEDLKGVHHMNPLAVRIALDRATGALRGSVTASYLATMLCGERRTAAFEPQTPAVPYEVVARALTLVGGAQ